MVLFVFSSIPECGSVYGLILIVNNLYYMSVILLVSSGSAQHLSTLCPP